MNVEIGDAGLWYVTSPDPELKGLLVAGKTMNAALRDVARCIEDMRTAKALAESGSPESQG